MFRVFAQVHFVSVFAIIAEGATIDPGKTWRAVPAMSSQTLPSVGVRGAGSISEPGTTESRTWLFGGLSMRGVGSKAEKVRLSEEATGDRIEEILERVSLTEERKSMR